MRFGIDGHVLTGKFQGTRTTVRSLLLALPKHLGDIELVIYTMEPTKAVEEVPGVSAEFIELNSRNSFKRLFYELPRRFKQDRIDVSLFNYIAPFSGRSVVVIHDLLPFSHPHLFPRLFRWRSRVLFSISMWRAWRIVAVSDYTAETIKQLFPGTISKVRVVKNGPSFATSAYFLDQGARAQERRYVLAVGRIEQRKNVHLLAEAFLNGAPDDVDLIIIGSQDFGFDYKLPNNPRIRQIRGVSDDDLMQWYRSASLFVYPSQAEGFGLPLLDATLFGVPTIASVLTAMPEVAGDLAEYFDPTMTGALDWLSARIHAHFSGNPVRTPTVAERQERAGLLSWDSAAKEMLKVIND